MNVFSRFLPARSQRESGLENPSVDLVAALVAQTDGASFSGINVTPEKALRLTAVYACVRAIAESCGSLPLPIQTIDDSGKGRDRLPGDPRTPFLNGRPNPEMTSIELWETWVAHAMLWGRGYIYIDRNNAGALIGLWPLNPARTEERRSPGTNELYYMTELASGEKRAIPADRVLALHGILKLSPVMVAREAISAAAAAEEYAGRFWHNNARPGGVIEISRDMDDEEFDQFKQRWRTAHEGLKRSQLVGILTGGAKWHEVGVAPGLAQFIETRQFGVREIARLFRVPPHMIADLEGTVTRASIEQQSIEFVTYTLRPWLVRMEQAIRMRLFARPDDLKNEIYPEFDVAALMRGDVKSRYDAYAVGIQWGFLNRADARGFENLPLPEGSDKLEEFLVPLNMIPSSQLGQVVQLKGGTPSSDAPAAEENADPQALALLSLLMRNEPALSAQLEAAAQQLLLEQSPAADEADGTA